MAKRNTFAPLHPTTRKYVSGEVEREPLPQQLQELVERLREAEPDKEPCERERRERDTKQPRDDEMGSNAAMAARGSASAQRRA